MADPYCCPNCGTNRTWFNKVKQLPISVKMNPENGDIVEEFSSEDDLPPFLSRYRGPEYQIQCGVCGLIAEEIMFIKKAQNNPRTVRS